ncbi:MAG TPA: FtsX-like permease family protein, partial [Ktedonobacterales bacterium]
PLYSSLMSEGYLQHILALSSPTNVNLEIIANTLGITPAVADGATKTSTDVGDLRAGAFTTGSATYLESQTRLRFAFVNGANPVAAGVLPGPFDEATVLGYDMAQAAPHMQLFAGRLPQDTPAGQPFEVLITKEMDKLHLGDTISFVVSGLPTLTVAAKVVGVWYPKDTNDTFWNGRSFAHIDPHAQDVPPTPAIFPVLFTKNAFVSALQFTSGGARAEGPVSMSVHTIFYTDPARITPESAPAVIDDIKTLRTLIGVQVQSSLGVLTAALITNLDTLLRGVLSQTALLGLPFDIFVVQVLGLTLLFVVAVTGILVESQTLPIATLKSRGASLLQLLGGYSLQGLILAGIAAVPALLLAPSLALAIVASLLPAGGNGVRIEQQYLASIASVQGSLLPAAIGAGLALVALLLAVAQAARLDVLALRREQGRTATVPFWKRYYLDLALVVLCAAGYLELTTFGGIGTQATLASSSAPSGPDPLLFATPSLLLLAGALLALRVVPLLAHAGAALSARDRGATSMMAFTQVARGGSFARLTLLLTLALGFGLFALTFQSSLARNSADRAAYIAGADERIVPVQGASDSSDLSALYAKLPGVTQVMPVDRTHGSQLSGGSIDASILAFDPRLAAQVVSWRADYAPQSLAELMGGMRSHTQGASAGDASHPIWALVDPTFAANQNVRVGDSFKLASETGTGAITYVVGGIVNDFPTLFDGDTIGYLVVDLADYSAAVQNPQVGAGSPVTPSEYWLRTTDDAAQAGARASALNNPAYLVNSLTDRHTLLIQFQSDPLQTGMVGLLLLGTATAALLALIGTIVQAALAAGQRTVQFAILRTLGMSTPQLLRLLLAEQAIVFAFGLLGGTLLGILLAMLTLPFLQVTSAAVGSGQLGIPPYQLVFNPQGSALFYVVLLAAFVLGPLLMTRLAAVIGLGKALRIGED